MKMVLKRNLFAPSGGGSRDGREVCEEKKKHSPSRSSRSSRDTSLVLAVFCALCALCGFNSACLAQNTAVIGNAAYTNTLIVATTPTKLYSVTGYNSGPSQFIQVFETNAPPANGVIPVFSIPVSSGQYFDFDFSYYGADLDSIVVCDSTTANTLTLGAVNCGIQAIIKNIPMTGAGPVPTGH
jgi:hypothetical protein